MSQLPADTSVVYFLQIADGPIKIGSARKFWARYVGLCSGMAENPKVLGVIEGNIKQERELQAKFAHLWIRREWFKPDQELLDFIANNAVDPPVRYRSNGRGPGRPRSTHELASTALRLPAEQLERWRTIAAAQSQSLSSMIRQHVEQAINASQQPF